MCGRFTLRTNPRDWAEIFAVVRQLESDWLPAYNIAPTQQVVCVRERADEPREYFKARWGLIPSWAKDMKIGASCTNAHVETVDSKPAFRNAFRKRRCLVIANGFYEWRRLDRVPHYITLKSGEPMAFAGLWESWRENWEEPGEALESCTICTTDANDMMGQLHDRMPVIVPPHTVDHWLDPMVTDTEELKPRLAQFPSGEMQSWPVGKAVGNVRNQGPQLIEPVGPVEEIEFE
jgi:putative SOS response-associated peptidase YedK